MDAKKRMRNEAGFNSNGAFKKSKQEMESGIGAKSKPCTKFFSMAGCPFGEGCHFLHYVPGGYNTVAHMSSLGSAAPPVSRKMVQPNPAPNGSAPPSIKSRICSKFNTAEGCKFGDKCHFAHGEWELGKPFVPSHDDSRPIGHAPNRMGMGMGMGMSGRMELPQGPSAGTFGASATAKISVDASLASAIIGKGGVNSKQICRQTGTKLSIRGHESDPNLRSIEFEGSFEQIQLATAMVRELIVNIGPSVTNVKPHGAPPTHGSLPTHGRANIKTKLCENFGKGSCTFGERCHFAHGASELRKSGV